MDNVTTTIRRFLLGALISRVLPLVLEDIRVGHSLTDEIEEALAKMLKADGSDRSARDKLRLIRFWKVSTKPDIAWRLAVMMVVGAPVEELQYQLLGFGRQRFSLADLVHPRTSPTIVAQSRLFKLAK